MLVTSKYAGFKIGTPCLIIKSKEATLCRLIEPLLCILVTSKYAGVKLGTPCHSIKSKFALPCRRIEIFFVPQHSLLGQLVQAYINPRHADHSCHQQITPKGMGKLGGIGAVNAAHKRGIIDECFWIPQADHEIYAAHSEK